MRRAQMQGEMFIYLMTMLVIGLLLFLGVKWILDLIERQRMIELIQFRDGLQNEFGTISHGTTKELELHMPAKINRLCFLDTRSVVDYQQRGLCMKDHPDYDPLVCDAWQDNSSAVFFSPPSEIECGIGVVGVDNQQGYLCYDTGDSRTVNVVITGVNSYVKVSDE